MLIQDVGNTEKSVQTESQLRTIKISISQTTASHWLVKHVIGLISFEYFVVFTTCLVCQEKDIPLLRVLSTEQQKSFSETRYFCPIR